MMIKYTHPVIRNPVIVKRYTDHDEYLKHDILKVKQYILFKRGYAHICCVNRV